jgi:hypothetical protein
MKRLFQICSSFVICIALFGCAHPISMVADRDAIKSGALAPINKNVGYAMSDASRALEVTTPGGGGDKVRYFPYRDLEPALYQALSVTFTDVTKLKDAKDIASVKASGIALLITPEIATTSSSSSALTWPPTKFTVTLICTITDVNGQTVDTVRVTGDGQAEFAEFKSNFSLAAVRASNDVVTKLVQALRESKALRE